PIAFLLFAFLIGFAVVLGAQLNNAIQEIWPVRPSERRHRIQTKLGIRKLARRLPFHRGDAPARRRTRPSGSRPPATRVGYSPPPGGNDS
ncbi:MAG: YihY/virulence factor BrkB family protein, partial [Pseudonocardia sp.]|nr:YihY/virulence factor BrkB family protein [Pseudonocardia sp.]